MLWESGSVYAASNKQMRFLKNIMCMARWKTEQDGKQKMVELDTRGA
jgi:hypothetical protein